MQEVDARLLLLKSLALKIPVLNLAPKLSVQIKMAQKYENFPENELKVGS